MESKVVCFSLAFPTTAIVLGSACPGHLWSSAMVVASEELVEQKF